MTLPSAKFVFDQLITLYVNETITHYTVIYLYKYLPYNTTSYHSVNCENNIVYC